MATPTSNLNYDPNAKFDNGQAAAGCMRTPNGAQTTAAIPEGLTPAGVLNNSTLRVGFNAIGMPKNNIGPNAIGQPTAINPDYPAAILEAPASKALPSN